MGKRGTGHTEFGFREQPFAPTADPTYFYATRDHKSCLFRLWNSIDERHGIAVVLGNFGTGKTTLLRKLMTGMAAKPSIYNTAVIGSPIPSWTSFALLEAIVKQFKLAPAERTFAAYMESLNRYLLANRDRINTLIIDDAQNLNKRGQLELLRLAQNLETQQHKLLNLVLFAQLEWARVLDAAPNFKQRVNLTYTLKPLGLDDVQNFIRFRMSRAALGAGSAPEFDAGAVKAVHAYSQGNPRLIVTVCRNTLLLASLMKTRAITRDMVEHTIRKTTAAQAGSAVQAASAAAQAAPQPVFQPQTIPASADTEILLTPEAGSLGGAAATPFTRRKPGDIDRRANALLLGTARTDDR